MQPIEIRPSIKRHYKNKQRKILKLYKKSSYIGLNILPLVIKTHEGLGKKKIKALASKFSIVKYYVIYYTTYSLPDVVRIGGVSCTENFLAMGWTGVEVRGAWKQTKEKSCNVCSQLCKDYYLNHSSIKSITWPELR